MRPEDELTRRDFVEITAAAVTLTGVSAEAAPVAGVQATVQYSLIVNGERHDVDLDPRVTLLDLLRERFHFTGTRKGCDHGQCGACTVLVNGVRINSCLTLAVAQDGSRITTIEGLANGDDLHPMQAAFIEHDGFQCGFCTAGQICSAVAMLEEWRAGKPSAVTPVQSSDAQFTDAEIRERMAGNICRCGAYPNIVAAIRTVEKGSALDRSPL
jgi:xanthine dehydrogenase YagT iron-sulfur-binding subunit